MRKQIAGNETSEAVGVAQKNCKKNMEKYLWISANLVNLQTVLIIYFSLIIAT